MPSNWWCADGLLTVAGDAEGLQLLLSAHALDGPRRLYRPHIWTSQGRSRRYGRSPLGGQAPPVTVPQTAYIVSS
jgi:hypothetical protein